jgi:phospholipase C
MRTPGRIVRIVAVTSLTGTVGLGQVGTTASAASPVFSITGTLVPVSVSAVPARTVVPVGTVVAVNGTITHAPSPCPVVLQRLTGATQWREVNVSYVRVSGRYTLLAQPSVAGPNIYRTFFPRCGNYGQATSAPFAITATVAPAGVPIRHVILIYQENHTFDNILGGLCVQQGHRCDGVSSGLAGGTVVPLKPAPDIVPTMNHTVHGQATAIDGGKMDGFYKFTECAAPAYACYTQATQSEIPNLWNLATNYAISDTTFAQSATASWQQHLQMGALVSDGFYGDNPLPDPTLTGGTGWSCASNDHVLWGPSLIWVPPCVPDPTGHGPRKPSPVRWVPNFYVDDLAAHGVSYGLYGAHFATGKGDAIWCAGCMFASWEDSSQNTLTGKPSAAILTDIKAGKLPQFSFVTPTTANSQHNNDSLTVGDNWIGSIVSAVQASPYWASTAIVIAYDDCGCFYDHVPPPAGMGMRTPLVIVSPYAKAGYVDHSKAAFAPSMDAFVEWVFGLPTLTPTTADNGAYAWQNAFDFTQTPLPRTSMNSTVVPQSSVHYLSTHPASQTADADS